MVWFKVDDSFPTHRKVLAIPRGPRRLAAIGAWTLVGAWVAGNSNDGHVPEDVLSDFAVTPKVATDLVTAGLWRRVPDGYEVHDFLDYNPSKEKVDADRAAAAERQRRGRERQKMSRRDSRVSHADVTSPVTDSVTVVPTRPDPTPTTESPSDSPPVAALPDRFADFWEIYPRRVARGAALKAWKTATKKTDPDTIITAASLFSAGSTDPKFIPHPATWLNAERWADERPQLRAVNEGWAPGQRGSWDV